MCSIARRQTLASAAGGPARLALPVLVCMATVAFTSGCGFFARPHQGREVLDTWETGNQVFKVRVTAYDEEGGGFVPGAYYVFQSAAGASKDWKDIMTFRNDDPIPIPRGQIHFMNDRIGYVFMGWMYAVTTDGGVVWSVWSAENDLPGWQCCNYGLIVKVDIAPNGRGTMTLNPIPGRRGEVPSLHTDDYGKHWSVK